MNQVKQSKVITIKESNPSVFDAKVNDFLSMEYEIIEKRWHDQNGELCITFEFYDKVWKATTLKERYELLGEQCYCGECPKLQINPDGRVKNQLCTKTGAMKKISSHACNWYYCYLEGRSEDEENL